MKLEIAKSGHLAEKSMRLIEYGWENESGSGIASESAEARRQQRIERLIMKEFNMINMSRIQSAIQAE